MTQVRGNEGDVVNGGSDCLETATLVNLSRRMVDLKEADSWLAKAQAASVVAGPHDNDLGDALRNRFEDLLIDKSRADFHRTAPSKDK